MPIRRMRWITRQEVRDNPDKLFLFGDNLRRTGYGGQAREMRGEPNAVGIPTKREPSMVESAFFTDQDLPAIQRIYARLFELVEIKLKEGGCVIIPYDGLGSGRAQLAERAPKIHALLEDTINGLTETYQNKEGKMSTLRSVECRAVANGAADEMGGVMVRVARGYQGGLYAVFESEYEAEQYRWLFTTQKKACFGAYMNAFELEAP